MRFNDNILREYISHAPFALAFERVLECTLFKSVAFDPPILDVGCGDGLFAKVLFADQIDTGIDPNSDELKLARETGIYRELINCSGASVPKPDGSYRTIFSNSVLEHIPDLRPVLREARRLLAPGGRLYATVPSANFERFTSINLGLEAVGLHSLAQRYRNFFNHFWAHHHAYSMQGWLTLAIECGFQPVEAFTYNPRRICLLNAALTPLALPSVKLKKISGRWILLPRLRARYCQSLSKLAARILHGGERAENGGLIFMALRKR